MLYKNSRINLVALARVIGLLLLIEALFMLIPFATCLIYGENDYKAFLITILITAGIGSVMAFAIKPENPDMGKREGFLLTALTWVVFSIFGMLPFMIGGSKMSISDAFFETMSGFTTTGATVMTSIDHFSNGIHIWRCLMQWIGGMGIILFTLAVLPMLNHSGGMQMFNAEVTGVTRDKLRPRISQTAKGLWLVYVVLTAILCGFAVVRLATFTEQEFLCYAAVDDVPREHLVCTKATGCVIIRINTALGKDFLPLFKVKALAPCVKLHILIGCRKQYLRKSAVATCKHRLKE
jgi:Trk-type K+ transport system membrane component